MSWRGLLLRKELVQEKAKNILAVLAVLLGVALIVATATTIASTKQGFLQMADSASSNADLLATSVADQKISTASFDDRDGSIQDAVPFFSEDSYYENSGSYHTLTLMAVDFTDEARHGGYSLREGSLPGDGECLITQTMAKQFHLAVGDTMQIRTNDGSMTRKISGVVQDGGIASDNFDQCVLTDIRDFSGYGTMTYKLMLKSGAGVKAEKAALQKELGGKYTVDYPQGKAEEFLSEADTLFDTMMGFGLLTLLLGIFLINVTVNESVRKMRAKISILKVLGAQRPAITRLILEKSLVTGLVGAALGVAAGALGSLGLIRLVDRSFNGGGMAIPVSFPWAEIVAVAVGAALFCLLASLPASLRATREEIVAGFRQYDRKNNISLKRKLIAAGLFLFFIAARLLLRSSAVGKLTTFLALAAGVYFAAAALFLPCTRLILKLFGRVSPFNAFTVRNNLKKQSGRAVHLAVLFTFVIAISVGIYFVVNEISDATRRMENGLYFGDAVVSSVTGNGISHDTLQKIESAQGAGKVYPIYQKYLYIGKDDVQIKGYRLDDTTLANFTDNWGIGRDEAQRLSGENTIILAEQVLSDLNLRVGELISVNTDSGMKTFDIVGTYATLNNNGITGIVSDHAFLQMFKDYSIRGVNVFQKSGTDFESLKTSIAKNIDDRFIQIQSVGAVRSAEQKTDDNFIILIDCMIAVLVIASVLILVNSISMNIKNNSYSLAVTKLLGATNRNLMCQNGMEGILYGVFGVIIGELCGTILGWIMTVGMNGMAGWNLRFTISPNVLLLFGVGFLLVAVLAEVIATALNYKSDYKSVLARE